MKKPIFFLVLASILLTFAACGSKNPNQAKSSGDSSSAMNIDSLAPISDSKTKFSNIIGWKNGQAPSAPEGFVVTRFAENIKSPRQTYIAPNGDVLIVLSNSVAI